MKVKVAVIMRTKNRPIFLDRAIKSVIDQTYNNWKLVIVNDGGNQEEVESVFKKYVQYKEQIMVIHHDVSRGMESASNIGIRAVDSDYIVIHDDDDTWQNSFLEKTVLYLEQNNMCQGIITHTNMIIENVENGRIQVKKTKPFNYNLKGIIEIYDICCRNLYPPISFIYRRSVLERIGLYDEELPVLGDWDFNLRFIREFDIYVLEEALANYHHRIKVKKGQYGNSIIEGKARHEQVEKMIKNKLLREDMRQGKIGLGVLINLSRQISKSGSIFAIREYIRRKRK